MTCTIIIVLSFILHWFDTVAHDWIYVCILYFQLNGDSSIYFCWKSLYWFWLDFLTLIISILFIFFGYYFLFSGYWGYNSLCRMAFYCGWIEHWRPAGQVLYFWPVLQTFPTFFGNEWFTFEFCYLRFTVLLFLDSIADKMWASQAGFDKFGLKFLWLNGWAGLLQKCPFAIPICCECHLVFILFHFSILNK